MSEELTTYMAQDLEGVTVIVSAYTESDAREQVEQLLGPGNVVTFTEM